MRGRTAGWTDGQVRIQRRVGEHPNIVYMKELVETPARQAVPPRERLCTARGAPCHDRWKEVEG